MITLNKFAQKCLDMMMDKFNMNNHTSRKGYSIRIGSLWRSFDSSSKYRDEEFPHYSEDEVWAAKIIIYLVAYLKRFGCQDIEQLIKDVIEKGDK